MPKTCNIDARGRAVRLIWGLILVLGGAVLAIVWAWPGGGWVAWTVCVLIAGLGAFAIYEARSGWCAVRAMGFRTSV